MRKLAILVMLATLACVAVAEPTDEPIYLAMGAATAGTQTISNIRGYVDTVYVAVSDGASTGTVLIAIVPLDTNVSAINIATSSVTASKAWYPVIDRTDTAGTALTSDPPSRYSLAGDSLRMIVSGSPTGVTWRATIKVER